MASACQVGNFNAIHALWQSVYGYVKQHVCPQRKEKYKCTLETYFMRFIFAVKNFVIGENCFLTLNKYFAAFLHSLHSNKLSSRLILYTPQIPPLLIPSCLLIPTSHLILPPAFIQNMGVRR